MLLLLGKSLVYFNSVSLTRVVRRHECQADAKRHDAQKTEARCQPKALRFYSLSNCIFGFSLILTFIVGDMEEASSNCSL